MNDHAPKEIRYLYTDFDSTGQRLNGTYAYTVTFSKSETPVVDGFWSLTLYNKEHSFAPNALNRYWIGTKSELVKDSSLTFYVQCDSPGEDREANWLPAPKEEFSLYIQAQWSEGKWVPPQIQRAS